MGSRRVLRRVSYEAPDEEHWRWDQSLGGWVSRSGSEVMRPPVEAPPSRRPPQPARHSREPARPYDRERRQRERSPRSHREATRNRSQHHSPESSPAPRQPPHPRNQRGQSPAPPPAYVENVNTGGDGVRTVVERAEWGSQTPTPFTMSLDLLDEVQRGLDRIDRDYKSACGPGNERSDGGSRSSSGGWRSAELSPRRRRCEFEA